MSVQAEAMPVQIDSVPVGRTAALIDRDALRFNVRRIREKLAPRQLFCAVVKADAYGHGVQNVIPVLEEEGVDRYAVAFWQEGARLRELGVKKPIQILGETMESEMDALLTYDLTPAIFTLSMAEALEEICAHRNRMCRIHLKLDTGMGRIGFFCSEEAADAIAQIEKLPHLQIEGVFSHFARADEADKTSAETQYERFSYMMELLAQRGITIPIRHTDNSASIMEFQHGETGMARAGIILYGLYPSDEVDASALALQPVLSWVTHVSFVKEVPENTPISYGGTFVTKRPSRIATIPVGYADGYSRNLSGIGTVLINGQEAPICGRVCMDQFMVDVTDIPEVQRGQRVILLGGGLSAERMAAKRSTINYEVVCGISSRVPRIAVH